MKKIIKWVIGIALAVALVCLAYRSGREVAVPEGEVIELRDTIVLRDTIKITAPQEVESGVIDTMILKIRDTVWLRDTLFVQLPRERKVYQDSNFRAVVSGVEPSLDEIDIYQNTQYIYITEKQPPKRWSVGIQTGVGFSSSLKPTPYIGIGVSYNIINF